MDESNLHASNLLHLYINLIIKSNVIKPCWRLTIGLAVLCFYSKTGFWPSYCQISTDLEKKLCSFLKWTSTVNF